MYWTINLVGGPKRVNHAAANVGHHIYSFGGYNRDINFEVLSPISIYDLNTVTFRWTEIKVDPKNYEFCPYERYGLTAVAYGTDIIIWGGRNDVKACNRTFIFDTCKKEWRCPKVTGSIPLPRDGHSACVINHRMYIFGGYLEDVNSYCNNVYYLDLKTMEWEYVKVKGDIRPPGRDFHSAPVIGSRMYIVGGRGESSLSAHDNFAPAEKYWSSVYYFDTNTNRWHKPKAYGKNGKIPVGRRSLSTFVYNGCIYMFGGCNGHLKHHFNDIHEFNPETNEWREIKPLGTVPIKRRRQCCVLVGDRAFIFGGSSPKPSSMPSIDFFPVGVQAYLESHNSDLEDLDDLFVLQLGVPSLRTLCCMNVIEKKLKTDSLPLQLQYDIKAMSTPNNIK